MKLLGFGSHMGQMVLSSIGRIYTDSGAAVKGDAAEVERCLARRSGDLDALDKQHRLSIVRKRLVPLFRWNVVPIQTLRISMATLLSIMLCVVRAPHWTRYTSINFLSKIFVLTLTEVSVNFLYSETQPFPECKCKLSYFEIT
uniref:Uncharacterized protein n=1 Tax=Macaca nemestrina TaxID=9545 RepID=A0A2K6AN09_MACNE